MNPGLPIRSKPAARTLCLKLLSGGVGAGLFCLAVAASAAAVEMDELMDNVMEDVRQETRQSIRQQVKQETQEVLTEEKVIPSNSLTGQYFGTVLADGGTFNCDLIFGTSTFTGTCTDVEGHFFSVSGSFTATTFTLNITETPQPGEPCPAGTESSSGSGTISGKGEPGTVISGSYGGTCGDSTQSFKMTKL